MGYQEGLALVKEKKFKEGIQEFHKAIDSGDNLRGSHFQLAKAYGDDKQVDKAVEYYKKTLEIDPKHEAGLYNLARLYRMQKKDNDSAIPLLEKCIELDPKDHMSYNMIGNCCSDLDRRQEAFKYFKKAIECKPDYSIAIYNLGNEYKSDGQSAEAIKYYTRYLELDPADAATHRQLGIAYSNTNKNKEAEENFKKALEIDPKYCFGYNSYGNFLKDSKRYEEAIKVYEKAVEIDPKYDTAYYSMGNLYNKMENTQKSFEMYNKAIEINDQDPLYWTNRGLLNFKLQHYDQALTDMKTARKVYDIPINRKDLTKANKTFINNNLDRDVPKLEKICSQAKNVLRKMKTINFSQKNKETEQLQQEQKNYQELTKKIELNTDNSSVLTQLSEKMDQIEMLQLKLEKQVSDNTEQIQKNTLELKKINSVLNDAGVNKMAEINSEIIKLQNSSFERFEYFNGIVSTVTNYIKAQIVLASGQVQNKEEEEDLFQSAFSSFASITENVPIVGSVFSIISRSVNAIVKESKKIDQKNKAQVIQLYLKHYAQSEDKFINEIILAALRYAKKIDIEELEHEPEDESKSFVEKVKKCYNSVKKSAQSQIRESINAYEDYPGLKGVTDGTFVISYLFVNHQKNLVDMKSRDLSGIIFDFLDCSNMKQDYLKMYAKGSNIKRKQEETPVGAPQRADTACCTIF